MKKPTLLHYYVTDVCNARCSFCDIWKNRTRHDATLEDVCNNLAAARSLGATFVDFTGGEPTLNKDLPLFLREAKRLGFVTSVTTNTILFPKMAEELTGLIDLLHFSLDGDNAQLHDHIRGVRSFQSTLDAIPLALQHKMIPDLLFTYTDENIDSARGVWEIARRDRLILILDPVFTLDGNDTVSAETHEKARKLSILPGVYLNTAHLSLRKQGGNQPLKPTCRVMDSTIIILANNHLALPCYHKQKESIPLNNDLVKVLTHSDAVKTHRKQQGTSPACKACHINCYMDPSFHYHKNSLFFRSAWAKGMYTLRKYGIDRQELPPVPRRPRGTQAISDKKQKHV